MKRLITASILCFLVLCLPSLVLARGKGYSSYRSYTSSHTKSYAYGVPRDSNGRIKRSSSTKYEFMKETGYPHGRKGYVVDHVVPLKRGGADSPYNMQWQTKEAAKAKDKWE
jgi:hypothetical protein